MPRPQALLTRTEAAARRRCRYTSEGDGWNHPRLASSSEQRHRQAVQSLGWHSTGQRPLTCISVLLVETIEKLFHRLGLSGEQLGCLDHPPSRFGIIALPEED